jgi:hypothetical protein
MSDWAITGWREPDEWAPMLRYFSSVVSPLVAAMNDDSNHTRSAAKYLVDKVVWGMTTCIDRQRWNLRYVSGAAKPIFEELHDLARQRRLTEGKRRLLPKLRHEHVQPRSVLVERLMDAPSEALSLLSTPLTCVVTKDEHEALAGTAETWERYHAAGVDVWDRKKGVWFIRA